MRKEPLRNTAKRSSLIDMKAAQARTDLLSAMGTAMLDQWEDVALLPTGTPLPGSRSVLWGTNSVFGGSVLSGTNVHGQSCLWSTYTLTQANIRWGSSVLWGTISIGQESTAPGRLFLTLRSSSTQRSCYVS